MKRMIPLNTDRGGASKTVLAGYYKFGVQTLLLGTFGSTGTTVLMLYLRCMELTQNELRMVKCVLKD